MKYYVQLDFECFGECDFIFKCRLQHVGKLVAVIIQHGDKHEDRSDIDQLVKDLVDDARETVETDENGLDQAEGSSKAQTPGISSFHNTHMYK